MINSLGVSTGSIDGDGRRTRGLAVPHTRDGLNHVCVEGEQRVPELEGVDLQAGLRGKQRQR